MKNKFWLGILGACVCASVVRAETTIQLDEIVVTPTRVAEDVGKAGSNVSVITHKDIEYSNARTVAQVLSGEPGVHVYSEGSLKNNVVDVGGYGDTAVRNVLVLVDGRRTNPVDISGPDWMQIPLESVERIEIIRGGASVLYGDNATGGVINIITKSGAGKSSASVFSEAGSYNSWKYGVDAGGSRGKATYYVYSGYSDTDGYRANSNVLAKDAQARASYDMNSQVKFGVEGGWHEDDYRLPGGIHAADLAALGRRGTDHPGDFGSTKDRFVKLSTELMPFEADGSRGTLYLDYSHRNRDTYGLLDYTLFSAGSTATKRGIDTDGVAAKYAVSPKVLDRDLKLVTGADFYQDRNRILGSGEGVSAITDDLVITKRELGVYGLAEYEPVDKLFVNAGIRREQAQYIFNRFDQLFYTTKNPHDTVFSGGVRYEYAERSNVFVSAQETFRFLATDEWYSTFDGLNTNLKQQTGVDYRAGVKHDLGGMADISATPFYIENKNEIFVDPTLGFQGQNSNYDRTRRIGIDLGQTFHVLKLAPIKGLEHLDVFTNYTYMRPEFVGGTFDGKLIPMVPEHTLSTGWDVGLAKALSWRVAGYFTGCEYAINDTANATAKVKPYTVVNTRLTYKFRLAEFYVGVNNLLDEKYNEYVVKGAKSLNKDYFPAAERNYVAGVKCQF